MNTAWNGKIKLEYHIYVDKAKSFVHKKDTYDSWALFIVENGCFKYKTDKLYKTAESGDLIICPPNIEFKRQVILPLSYHFIRCSFSCPHEVPEGRITFINQSRLFSTLDILRNLNSTYKNEEKIFKEHLITDIWYLHLSESTQLISDILCEDKLTEEILKYMTKNINEGIEAAASFFGISRVLLYKKVKNATGISPIQFITGIRMKKAEQLLTKTTLPHSKIALQCGYENEYYFSKAFKKYFNITPSAYRITRSV